ncbi:cysteine desulfurase family protein [Parablautia intestinalis]|jgi:cysteine desulfurase|uniref:cysteine desulfurase family protein n=1 Tax=Parablautia intestinalis TaxID=2320100 RepID=UPI0023C59BC9|nr:cysteine desulfurase family protein [Parablautia intestinalis]MCI8615266.1 cysteine desulfurase [Lachnospiraceae bacterium]MDE7046662.1 cysteine desulfurase [Lachnospiraceae bacterium]
MEVYLDNSATTRCFDKAAALMTRIMCEDYGNPSSLHRKGVEAEKYIRYAKDVIADNLKVNQKEIFFTSGGTESDNLALMGCARANCRSGRHLITTQIEHPAVLQTMKHLEEEGFRVTYLPVDQKGCIRLEDLGRAITGETILVSIMHTNNEVGSMQPVAKAGALIKGINPRILFHVDAVQGYGKCRIYPKRMKIDLLSASGHKIHGPKGTGFLYVDEKVKIKPIVFGGGQQNGIRSGTENVPGIAGLAKAIEIIYGDLDREVENLYRLKRAFVSGVQKIDDVIVNGHSDETGAPHIVSVSFKGVRSEVILHALEDKGVYVSAGSACSARKPQPSATLRAMGIEPQLLGSTIRFSFSVFTTMEEINYTLEMLYDIIPMLRKYTRQ